MGCLARLDPARGLEPDVPAGAIEQACPGAEKDRHKMDPHLVDEPGAQQLPADAGAEHVDVLVTGHRSRRSDRSYGARDEVVHTVVGDVLRCAVGHDDGGGTEVEAGAVGAPTRNRRVVGSPSGDTGADTVLAFGVHVAAALVVAEGPLVQDVAAVAHRLLEPRIGCRDVAVEGHADLESDVAHGVCRSFRGPAGTPGGGNAADGQVRSPCAGASTGTSKQTGQTGHAPYDEHLVVDTPGQDRQ